MNLVTAVQALVDAGVDFVIIGGWSAILHGSSFNTNDLDLCFSRRTENLRRLARALAAFHPRLRDLPEDVPFVWDEVTLRNGTIFTLSTDCGAIDLLAEVSGLGGFEEVKASSILVRAFDRDVWTLDLPNLIRAKRAAGREKDLRVLPELEGLLEAEQEE
ncbi:conserved hypothetical protein [Candidatus Sulfopaludibacter sp. SbA4]|nr:conserved hypothetical protein [Candidatus Sulfopaludibacter sp. SbA4]